MRKLKKLAGLSPPERRLFFEAVAWCALVRLTMLVIPFKRYAALLGTPGEETPRDEPGDSRRKQLEQIAAAICRCSKTVPWKSRCFVEAITTVLMLRRRKIKGTIYLGLAKDNGTMKAHAWLRCGNMILTGQKGMEEFTVVSSFG